MASMCVLVWPHLQRPTTLEGEDVWLLGWNPQGFWLIVAAAVASKSIDTITQQTQEIQQALNQSPWASVGAGPLPLQIIGFWREEGRNPCAAAVLMRNRSLWVEVGDGPVVNELYCCGIPYDPPVHVLWVEDSFEGWTPTNEAASCREKSGWRPHSPSYEDLRSAMVTPRLLPMGGSTPPPLIAAEAGVGPSGAGMGGPAQLLPSHTRTRSTGSLGSARGEVPRAASFAVDECRVLFEGIYWGTCVRARLRCGPAAPTNERWLRQQWCGAMAVWLATMALVVGQPLCTAVGALAVHSHVGLVLERRLQDAAACLRVVAGRSESCELHPWRTHEVGTRAPPHERHCWVHFIARVALDVCCGVVVAQLLLTHRGAVARWVQEHFYTYGVALHQRQVEWFLEGPVSAKLNQNLNGILHALVTLVLKLWGCFLNDVLTPEWVAAALGVVCAVCCFGVSVGVALMGDLSLAAITPIRMIYRGLRVVYMGGVEVMRTVWHLQRGKRYNRLRQRVEPCYFSSDEVLLGTLLGTATVFLLPTVALYFVYFSVVFAVGMWCREALGVIALLLCHSPVVAVVEWAGGRRYYRGAFEIRIGPLRRSNGITVDVSVVGVPMGLREVVADYGNMVERLCAPLLAPPSLFRALKAVILPSSVEYEDMKLRQRLMQRRKQAVQQS